MPRIDTDLQVQLVPGGPGMLKVLPCEYGPTQHCKWGNHGKCAHATGGPHEHGSESPSGYLTRRDSSVVGADDRPIQLLPIHRWHCPCECHQTILTLF